MRHSLLLLATLLLGSFSPAFAQRPLASLPIRMDSHLMVVEAVIGNGPSAPFVVDTSATHSVIDRRLQRALGLEILGSGATTGAGTGAVALQRTGPAQMRLGALALALPEPWVIDLSGVPMDPAIRGLLGVELFRSHVVRIDPVRRRLDIFDPRRFRAPRGARWIPLILDQDRLLIEVTLDVRPGLTLTERVRIQTGAEASVNHPIVAQAVERRQSRQGNGLGENFVAWSGRMRAVHIGPYAIRDVWGPGGPGPSIGMELLRRFVLTFDVARGRLYLVPTPALGEPVPPPPE